MYDLVMLQFDRNGTQEPVQRRGNSKVWASEASIKDILEHYSKIIAEQTIWQETLAKTLCW